MSALSEVHDSILSLRDMIRDVRETGAKSLSQRAKAATAISRVYVDMAVADDDIVLPLIGAINQIYVAYIITVLGLESFIAKGVKMRDLTGLVATESLLDEVAIIDKYFGKSVVSLEDIKQTIKDGAQDLKDGIDQRSLDRNDPYRTDEQVKSGSARSGAKIVQLTPSEQHLVTGRLIELDITTESGGSAPLRIYSQLVPRIVEPEVAGAFVTTNIPNSLRRRLSQLKAGEIRFWKDFVFAVDRLKALQDALKKDKTGELAGMVAGQNNALMRYMLSLSHIAPNANTASAVMIVDSKTFDKYLTADGKRFDDKEQSKFFSSSFMFMLAVVDRDYNEIDLYTHGIKGHGNYSFSAIEKVGSSKSQGMDLKDVMTVFGRGGNPRI